MFHYWPLLAVAKGTCFMILFLTISLIVTTPLIVALDDDCEVIKVENFSITCNSSGESQVHCCASNFGLISLTINGGPYNETVEPISSGGCETVNILPIHSEDQLSATCTALRGGSANYCISENKSISCPPMKSSSTSPPETNTSTAAVSTSVNASLVPTNQLNSYGW